MKLYKQKFNLNKENRLVFFSKNTPETQSSNPEQETEAVKKKTEKDLKELKNKTPKTKPNSNATTKEKEKAKNTARKEVDKTADKALSKAKEDEEISEETEKSEFSGIKAKILEFTKQLPGGEKFWTKMINLYIKNIKNNDTTSIMLKEIFLNDKERIKDNIGILQSKLKNSGGYILHINKNNFNFFQENMNNNNLNKLLNSNDNQLKKIKKVSNKIYVNNNKNVDLNILYLSKNTNDENLEEISKFLKGKDGKTSKLTQIVQGLMKGKNLSELTK